jgi:acetoin utilization protein AcuC
LLNGRRYVLSMKKKAENNKNQKHVLVYSDKLSGFDFGPAHPFKPMRARYMMELLSRYSLLNPKNQLVIAPEPIDENLLYLFHTREYIELLKRTEHGGFTLDMLKAGLGTEDNPIVPGIYDFCLTSAGGTLKGAEMLMGGAADVVFNPIGGFHHAGADHAEGFCYLNDCAVAIAEMLQKGKRIAYIDIDVHFGNGVRDAFASSREVLAVSIHESGSTIYPWTGFQNDIGVGAGKGYTVNIPLLQKSDDEVYLYAFESIVPPLVGAFKPDIVVAVIGADIHREDLLGHLSVTSFGYEKAVRIIREISPLLLATGGGGYNVYKTAALWTLAWAAICGLEPVDNYAGLVGGMMYGPETQSGTLHDKPFATSGDSKNECFEHAREVVAYLKKNVFPIHGL